MQIGNKAIEQGGRPYIIAEIGQAHEGSLAWAELLIYEAHRAGVDAVKWQYHLAEFENPARKKYWSSVEFSHQDWRKIRAMCAMAKLDFIISCFSLEAVERARTLDPHAWKIPSAPFWLERLQRCAEDGKPMIISTGMSTREEIDRAAVNPIHPIALMQCTSAYPTRLDQVGLNCITELHQRYDLPVGLSDHSGTIWPSVAAMTLGAALVEVHLCLSRAQRIPDGCSSVEFQELRQICEARDALCLMRQPVDKEAMARDLAATRRKYAPYQPTRSEVA